MQNRRLSNILLVIMILCLFLGLASGATYILSSAQMSQGAEKILTNGDKMRFSFGDQDYYFELVNSSVNNAVASLSSLTDDVVFNLDEEKQFDLDKDGSVDLSISLDISNYNRSGFKFRGIGDSFKSTSKVDEIVSVSNTFYDKVVYWAGIVFVFLINIILFLFQPLFYG